MLTYPIDEAEELLAKKLNAALTSRRNCEEDLEFLREQITVRAPSVCFWGGFCSFVFVFFRLFFRPTSIVVSY